MMNLSPLVGAAYLVTMLALTGTAIGQVNVLTNRYNPSRTAANLSETILNTTNVVAGQFGKLGTYPVDGVIYAQPLYVQGVTVNGAVHNVLYVATMHNVLYAFDADNVGSAPLWSVDFRSQGYQPFFLDPSDGSVTGAADAFGIFSTPVIDLSNNRIIFVTESNSGGAFTDPVTCPTCSVHYNLWSLDIRNGTTLQGPVEIEGSTSLGQAFGPTAASPTWAYGQRPGLEIADQQIWVSFGSRPTGDTNPWSGWLFTYSATTLAQTGVFSSSASTSGNSFWQSGMAPAVDASGNVYFTTGNGGTYDGATEFPQSLLKFGFGVGPALLDWYTPDNPNGDDYIAMNTNDLDLSVCGPMLIPGTDLVVVGNKTADVTVAHTGSLGHLTAGDTQLAQFFHVGAFNTVVGNDQDRIVGMSYWQQGSGGTLFVWPGQDTLHAFSLNPTKSTFTQTYAGSLALLGNPSTALALSANGSTAGTGILWAPVQRSSDGFDPAIGTAGVLRAFNASNPSQELWNSDQVATDSMGTLAKFVPATVANGKVYIANSASTTHYPTSFSNGSVTVYGLLHPSTQQAQTITFVAPGTQTVGTPLALSASASSGLAVTFGSSTTAVCTVSGTTATFLAAGTCGITAMQPGNGTYAAATPVSRSFTVNPAVGQSQTITFGTVQPQTVGASLALTATASSGLAVSFSSSTGGVCAVSGGTVTFVAAGTCSITATQPGNATYAAANPVSQSFRVNAAGSHSQTITFGALAAQNVGTSLTLTASASSGLTVSYSAPETTTVCSVSGSTATFFGVGTCTITAAQPGNGTYAAATSVSQSFTVSAAGSSVISGAAGAWTFDSVASATSPDVTGNGNTLYFKGKVTTNVAGIGGSAIQLSGAGDAETTAAVLNTAGSFTVSAWVNFSALAACGAQTVVSQDGKNDSGFYLGILPSCTGSSFRFSMQGADSDAAASYAAVYNATIATSTWYHLAGVRNASAGTMSLYVNGVLQSTVANTTSWSATGPLVVGRGKFSAGLRDYVTGSIDSVAVFGSALTASQVTALYQQRNIALASQTITFANPATQTVGTPLTLTAMASSGLPVSYSASTTSVCIVSGSTATFLTPGTCTITAAQAGSSVYAAANSVSQTFTVNAAITVLSGAAGAWTFDADTATTASDITGNGNTLSFTNVTATTAGRSGAAIQLKGNGYAQAGGAVLNTAGSFTVSAWVNFSSLAACGAQTLLSQDGNNDSGFYLGILPNCTGSSFRFSMQGADSDSAATYAVVYNATIATGTWYHLVGVRNASAGTMSLYVNGVLQGTVANTTSWSAAGPLAVGRAKFSAGLRDYVTGSIDSVAVFGSALTAAQVTALYLQPQL